jgi:hypothetical protein
MRDNFYYTGSLLVLLTGALPSDRRLRIDDQQLLELSEVITFVDCLAALCFTVSSAVHAWVFVHDLSVVDGSCQLH